MAFALALLVVVAASDVSEETNGGGANGGAAQEEERSAGQDAEQDADAEEEPRVPGRFYTVKTGDTLAGIAERVGVSVDRLQELNPQLDPQALVSGQKIKLRE